MSTSRELPPLPEQTRERFKAWAIETGQAELDPKHGFFYYFNDFEIAFLAYQAAEAATARKCVALLIAADAACLNIPDGIDAIRSAFPAAFNQEQSK